MHTLLIQSMYVNKLPQKNRYVPSTAQLGRAESAANSLLIASCQRVTELVNLLQTEILELAQELEREEMIDGGRLKQKVQSRLQAAATVGGGGGGVASR